MEREFVERVDLGRVEERLPEPIGSSIGLIMEFAGHCESHDISNREERKNILNIVEWKFIECSRFQPWWERRSCD